MLGLTKFILFSGNSNRPLAQKIANYLGLELGQAEVGRFPDGEISVHVHTDVRGADVFLVQSTCPPVNENIMELLVYIDCLKRASVGRLTAVMPYFGYARQDRKDTGRVPISAKLIANLLVEAGCDRVLTIDLHAAQIQGFFDIPVDHLYAAPIFTNHFKSRNLNNTVVTGPDIGSLKRAWGLARRLGAGVALIQKERISATQVESGFLMGHVTGMNVIVVDDMLATCGTVRGAVRILKDNGATTVTIAATHAVLCGPALERLVACEATEILLSDTIPVSDEIRKSLPNLKILSVAEIIGEAILRIHENRSVSQLFGN